VYKAEASLDELKELKELEGLAAAFDVSHLLSCNARLRSFAPTKKCCSQASGCFCFCFCFCLCLDREDLCAFHAGKPG